MEAIWKFPVAIHNSIEIKAPKVIRWLDVQNQSNIPMVWAVVDTEASFETHVLHVRGTGHKMHGNEGRYIGTFQVNQGS